MNHVEGLRSIRIAGLDYSLLQVVRIHSHSVSPIELQVPPTVKAELRLLRTHYINLSLWQCSHIGYAVPFSTDLAGQIKILPITEDLPKRLARQLDTGVLGRVTIQPDQEALIGVYVSGEAASAIAGGHFEKKKAERVKVPDHCEARCDHKRTAANEFPLCWSGGRNNFYGIPFDKIQNCLDCGGGNQGSCEKCAAWETGAEPNYVQAGPNCLFCGELADGGHIEGVTLWRAIPEWRQEVIYAENVLSGIEDGDLNFEADPMSAVLTLRFADGSSSDDPASRQIPFLKQSVAQD
jgi:hypothetical protein